MATTTITSDDIRFHVTQATDASDGDYDVDAIVSDIVAEHGLVDVESIDEAAFWVIVARHALDDRESASAQQIVSGLRARAVSDPTVSISQDNVLWIADNGRYVALGGETGGWSFTVYGDTYRNEVITTDGVEGRGPAALAGVLDAVASHLR